MWLKRYEKFKGQHKNSRNLSKILKMWSEFWFEEPRNYLWDVSKQIKLYLNFFLHTSWQTRRTKTPQVTLKRHPKDAPKTFQRHPSLHRDARRRLSDAQIFIETQKDAPNPILFVEIPTKKADKDALKMSKNASRMP